MNYGEMLKQNRILQGKTLLDVERDTGISNANISRWERNIVIPNIDFCVKLADYYGVSLDELIGRDFPETTESAKSITVNSSFNNNTGNINFKS